MRTCTLCNHQAVLKTVTVLIDHSIIRQPVYLCVYPPCVLNRGGVVEPGNEWITAVMEKRRQDATAG